MIYKRTLRRGFLLDLVVLLGRGGGAQRQMRVQGLAKVLPGLVAQEQRNNNPQTVQKGDVDSELERVSGREARATVEELRVPRAIIEWGEEIQSRSICNLGVNGQLERMTPLVLRLHGPNEVQPSENIDDLRNGQGNDGGIRHRVSVVL